MRTIPRPVHGFLDYFTGLAIISCPFFLDFADDLLATAIAIIVGLGIILYSSLTAYELGATALLPFPVHRALDLTSGLGLILSAGLLSLGGTAAVFFIAIGIFHIGVALLTMEGRGHLMSPQR